MRRATLTLVGVVVLGLALAGGAQAQGLIGRWGGAAGDDPLPGKFAEMVDIAADSRGYVYTLDELPSGAGRVQKFTATGRLVRQFGVPADEDDRFDTEEIVGAINNPTALTVGPDRNVYVAESGSRTRISVWSPLGKYLRSFSSGGNGDGQLYSASGLFFDSTGKLGAADAGNSRIAIFGPGGNWVGAIPGFDGGPYDVTAMGDAIYTGAGSSVYVLRPSGVSLFGERGSGPGQFGATSSVAAGGNTVYVADADLSRVQAFSPDGAYLRGVGLSPGSGPGQFVKPNAVAVDCRGTLYVADSGNFRVQRFGVAGAAPCGDYRKDKQERLVIKLTGPRSQRFRDEFAVQATVSCDRPCRGSLTGRVSIKGRRKPILLTNERLTREFPGRAVTNVAPTERGTDIIVAALERRRRMTARIKLVARDLTGRRVVRKRSYRLR